MMGIAVVDVGEVTIAGAASVVATIEEPNATGAGGDVLPWLGATDDLRDDRWGDRTRPTWQPSSPLSVHPSLSGDGA